jgi:hypothetical protein
MINKKANVGPVGAVLLFIFFIINWFIWLGKWITEIGQLAITSGNLSGIEAFFFANLNFFVFICLLLGVMGFIYFGGGQQ